MLVVTCTYCELLTCISVVVPLVGGVKGTKNVLVVRGTSSDFNVYQRRRFVCVRLGGLKGNLKLMCLSLNVPPPIC